MNDAKSMLMMYSYAAMKAAEDKEDTTKAKDTTKAANVDKQTKEVKTKRRGKKNDKGTEGRDSTVTKE